MGLLSGEVSKGVGNISKIMKECPKPFYRATGVELFPGSINVKVKIKVPIKEEFRVLGSDVNWHEDFIFEQCKINGVDAYRLTPVNPETGKNGGRGDDEFEITLDKKLDNVSAGSIVSITLFREV